MWYFFLKDGFITLERMNFMPSKPQSPFHIGLRTTKTAISVGLCVLLFKLINRGSPMLAAISSIFTLRTDHNETVTFGKVRVFGNILGGVLAAIFIYIKVSLSLGGYADIIFAPLAVIIIILFSNQFNPSGIISTCATFCVIYFNVENDENISFAIQRVLDTVIGAIIAIVVNIVLPNHYADKKAG